MKLDVNHSYSKQDSNLGKSLCTATQPMGENPIKKLGFGFMRLPLLDENNPASIDLEQTKKMVDTFLAHGFTYFDTAWMYCGFQSEHAIRKVLVERYPRDRFTLATKLHIGYVEKKQDREDILFRQLEKTGVKYFDYYLLHDVNAQHLPLYERYDCFTWLLEKRQQGVVRNIGISFHGDAPLLEQVLTDYPFLDFVQLQINYLDWENPGVQSRLCYETALRHKKPVVVMEPVKGGALAHVPEEAEQAFRACQPHLSIASWAIRFAASLNNVITVLSGMSNLTQLEDNISFMTEFHPVTDQEKALVLQWTPSIQQETAIPCTGCGYCLDGCPKHIAIPKYFGLYNTEHQCNQQKGYTSPKEYYNDTLTRIFGAAGDCLHCGKCEKICPQHLPIMQYLKAVANYFGK